MTTTRLAIIQRMGDALGLRLSGTLSSSVAAASTSVQDATKRHEQDDYPNEGFFLATSSGGVVEEHRISDFANATQTLSLYGSGLSTSLSSGLTYDVLLPPVTPDQYRAAIKAAASKIAGRGIARRALDTSLVTTFAVRYALPSAIDIALTECFIQPQEFITNNLWLSDGSGWTLHANASLTNDGTNSERTLKLIATDANQHSYAVVDVSPLDELEFFATVKSNGTAGARWQVQIYDDESTVISSYATIGTAVTAAAWTQQTGVIRVPANGARLRIAFNASAAATVYSQGPQLMRYGQWERLPGWKVEYDGNTGYVRLPATPPQGRRLRLVGKRTLESLSADTDTVSMDEPEIVAFTELCCAEAWRAFGGRLGMAQSDVEREAVKHEALYRELIGRLSSEWRQTRKARLPLWGSRG